MTSMQDIPQRVASIKYREDVYNGLNKVGDTQSMLLFLTRGERNKCKSNVRLNVVLLKVLGFGVSWMQMDVNQLLSYCNIKGDFLTCLRTCKHLPKYSDKTRSESFDH